jgi:DNA-binding transcriptional MerR regulator
MTISEVSGKYSLSPDTLRYYEKEGLVKSHRKPSGIRFYTEEDCRGIEFITCMRNAGLSIEVLKKYLRLYNQGDKTIPARIELLKAQLGLLKEKREGIDKSIERLEYKIDNYGKILAKEKEIKE